MKRSVKLILLTLLTTILVSTLLSCDSLLTEEEKAKRRLEAREREKENQIKIAEKSLDSCIEQMRKAAWDLKVDKKGTGYYLGFVARNCYLQYWKDVRNISGQSPEYKILPWCEKECRDLLDKELTWLSSVDKDPEGIKGGMDEFLRFCHDVKCRGEDYARPKR